MLISSLNHYEPSSKAFTLAFFSINGALVKSTVSSHLIAVEVKNTFEVEDIAQLKKNVHHVKKLWSKPVWGFIGGPLIEKEAKAKALEEGFGVVELSGDRYEVIEPDQDNGRKAAGHG